MRSDLLEGDPVVPPILIAVRDLDPHVTIRAGRALHELAELADGHVEPRVADVEDLALHELGRCLEDHHDRAREIADVNERPPLIGADDRDDAVHHRLRRKEVRHQVEARPARMAEYRRKPQHRHEEVVAAPRTAARARCRFWSARRATPG